MYRGELSNRAAPMILVDWRILLEEKKKAFQVLRTREYEYKDGAYGWIDRTLDVRICVAIIGKKSKVKGAVELLLERVAEVEVFENASELWTWLFRNPQVVKFYTNDSSLRRMSYDGLVSSHSGWNQKV
jgi:hypothetical protein